MLERAEHEATRVQALVIALEQKEITLDEFSDVVKSLTPEAIQVTSFLLRNWNDATAWDEDKFCAARIVCGVFASKNRNLS